MGRHPLTSVAALDPGPIPTFRLLLVVFTALLLFAFSLSNSHGVEAHFVPVPVIVAPQQEEYQANTMEGENSRLGEQEVTRLKQRILEGLGLTRAPDASKVSHA
jgi:hypothetical protein